jgi:hypothetical protein
MELDSPTKKAPSLSHSYTSITSLEYFRSRRTAIYYEFLLLGAPDERLWEELNFVKVSLRMKWLGQWSLTDSLI